MAKVEISKSHDGNPQTAERLQPQPTIDSVEIGSAHVPVSLEVILPGLDSTKAGGLYPSNIEHEFEFRDTVQGLIENLDPSAIALDGISKIGLKELSHNLSLDYVSKKITEAGGHTHLMPHVSWVNELTEDLDYRLSHYEKQGVDQVVISAIPEPSINPSGHMASLIKLIRDNSTAVDTVGVQVDISGCFPALNPAQMDSIARNLEMADFAITQFLFNVYDYVIFRKEMDKRDINTPIIPGVLAFANFEQAKEVSKHNNVRFSEFSVRDNLLQALPFGAPSSAMIDPSDPDNSAPYIKGICGSLIKEGAPGLHIYTLNNAPLTIEVAEGLRT